MNICIIIPCFNHTEKLTDIIRQFVDKKLNVILVDDASDTHHSEIMDSLATQLKNIHLIRHQTNQGKGGAVVTGLLAAEKLGYSHALQIDADGQHDLDDIEKFIAQAEAKPKALISGCPVYDDSIPKSRLYGRSITHFWVCIETLSRKVKDTMCGFRVYPLSTTCKLLTSTRVGKRMDFDIEIMVRLAWKNIEMIFIPTKVHYPVDGTSHFRPFEDNVKISWLHTRLCVGMIIRLPILLWRKLS